MVTSPDLTNQFKIYWQISNKQGRHLVCFDIRCEDPQNEAVR